MEARRAEVWTLPCRALGKTDAGGRWLRVHLERPGELLLRCLGLGEPGSGGRYVRTRCFGMLI